MSDRLSEVAGRDVPRETSDRLAAFAAMVAEENQRQNLVSKQDVADLWNRHVLDSAQLVRFAGGSAGEWVDIGSGPGFPGLVIAILTADPITLVEPRGLRVAFLEQVAAQLSLTNVRVVAGKAADVDGRFSRVTARAVASLTRTFEMTVPLSQAGTRWILPKGRNAQKEVEEARQRWQGEIRIEPSLTSPDGLIVVAEQIRPRGRGGR